MIEKYGESKFVAPISSMTVFEGNPYEKGNVARLIRNDFLNPIERVFIAFFFVFLKKIGILLLKLLETKVC